MTGGCQCGAVRFRCEPDPSTSHICHCRMCQKASGHFFAALVGVDRGTMVWTKAEPKRFCSSNHAARGFCSDCGTPLTYEAPDGIALATGAFDHPEHLPPQKQFGAEARYGFFADITELPSSRTSDNMAAQPYLAEIVSHQHADEPDNAERAEF